MAILETKMSHIVNNLTLSNLLFLTFGYKSILKKLSTFSKNQIRIFFTNKNDRCVNLPLTNVTTLTTDLHIWCEFKLV